MCLKHTRIYTLFHQAKLSMSTSHAIAEWSVISMDSTRSAFGGAKKRSVTGNLSVFVTCSKWYVIYIKLTGAKSQYRICSGMYV
jgi:hypothetical protein